MRGRRAVAVLVGAIVLLVVAVAVVVHHRHESERPASRGTSAHVPAVVPGRTVHVETTVPSTRFLPLGSQPQDGRTISAQHAYNLLVSGSEKLNPIPATVQAYYGVLTDASRSPLPVNVRVWAFAVESRCADAARQPGSRAAGPMGGSHCRLWEFVNARTGHDLGGVSREILAD